MKKLLVAVALLSAGAAHAQLVGGLGGTVGGAVSTSGGFNARIPDATAPIDRSVESATRAANDTANSVANDTRHNSVRVDAGTSLRVDRGTRCYYRDTYYARDYYYDPTYRDGYYYCERQSSGVTAGASVGIGSRR